MTFQNDDTQPRIPAVTIHPETEEEPASGPGCITWGVLAFMALVFSAAIVVLAGTAGWTAGQREAVGNANATRSAEVATQCALFESDVATRNPIVLNARYEYLATLTPAVSCVSVIPATATALFLTSQPTATATPTPTPTATATAAVTATPESLSTAEGGGYDLSALLDEAQAAITLSDWESAIETLDVIIGLDPDFEAATVRSLMSQATTNHARALYREGRLAEAIYWTDQAEQYGPIGDLSYERYVAQLYLDALRTEGTNYATTIQAWQGVYNVAPNYQDVAQRLFDAYVAYGKAWVGQGEYCPAYQQFEAALSILYDVSVVSQRDNANTICLQATPIPAPGSIPIAPGTEGTATIAPVGQP